MQPWEGAVLWEPSSLCNQGQYPLSRLAIHVTVLYCRQCGQRFVGIDYCTTRSTSWFQQHADQK